MQRDLRELLLDLQRVFGALHLARDNQGKRFWRGMISDLSQREDEPERLVAARAAGTLVWGSGWPSSNDSPSFSAVSSPSRVTAPSPPAP